MVIGEWRIENGTLNPSNALRAGWASQGTFNQETQAHIINKRTFHYANLILNRLMAMVKKNVIIPTSINVSFQTPVMPSPFIMTDFTIL